MVSCDICNKKMGLTPYDCKCGGNFCAKHRYADEHQCNHDYKSEYKRKLENDNKKIQADKITRI